MHILQRQGVSATAKLKAIENHSERPLKIVCASVSENHKDLQDVSICRLRTGGHPSKY